MRILVVGRSLPLKENYMLGSVEYEQAQMLARNGHEVYYLFIDFRSMHHCRKIRQVEEIRDGVHIVTLHIPIGQKIPASVETQLGILLRHYQLNDFSRKYGVPDVVNVHYPSIYPYRIFASLQKQGAKIIGTEHWSKVQNQNLPKRYLRCLRDFVKKSDALTCVGGNLKESIVKLTGTNRLIYIIPNIVSNVFCSKEAERSEKGFHFLAVGRLSKEKGYDKLIQAFCNTFKTNKMVHLHIVGGGKENDPLQKIILDNNAQDVVTLHGLMKRQDLAEFYHQCDALVMSSDYETFGVPAAEAMTCGLPVIVTQNTGIACYVNKDCGIVIEDNKIENISKAMTLMYETYTNYSKQLISEYATRHFSEPVVYEMIKEVFERNARGDKNDNS